MAAAEIDDQVIAAGGAVLRPLASIGGSGPTVPPAEVTTGGPGEPDPQVIIAKQKVLIDALNENIGANDQLVAALRSLVATKDTTAAAKDTYIAALEARVAELEANG